MRYVIFWVLLGLPTIAFLYACIAGGLRIASRYWPWFLLWLALLVTAWSVLTITGIQPTSLWGGLMLGVTSWGVTSWFMHTGHEELAKRRQVRSSDFKQVMAFETVGGVIGGMIGFAVVLALKFLFPSLFSGMPERIVMMTAVFVAIMFGMLGQVVVVALACRQSGGT